MQERKKEKREKGLFTYGSNRERRKEKKGKKLKKFKSTPQKKFQLVPLHVLGVTYYHIQPAFSSIAC